MKALCPPPCSGAQLLVWLLPFLEKRGQRELCQRYLWGWLGGFHGGLEHRRLRGPGVLCDRNCRCCICLHRTQQRREARGAPLVGHV